MKIDDNFKKQIRELFDAAKCANDGTGYKAFSGDIADENKDDQKGES